MDEIRLGSRTLQPRRQLLVNGRREPLGKRALDILSVLAEAHGAIVTKDELLEAVWPGVTVEENALQVHIVALRKALGPEADRLRTIRGVGYQLDVDGDKVPPNEERSGGTSASPPVRLGPAQSSMLRLPTVSLLRVARRRQGALVGVAVLLLTLVGAWWFAGPAIGLREHQRVPVVVRALTASGNGATEAALANGITDELIVRLRRLPELRVATAGAGGGTPGSAFQDAYTVDGSIRSVGDRVRLTTRLFSPEGEVLWSDTLDRELADLFDMQEELASKIASALSVSFDIGADSSEFGGTDNPDAYAAYLLFRANQTNADQSVPLRHLERALHLDPDYGKALNSLSISYGIRASGAASRAEAVRLLAEMDARTSRAVSDNPDLAIAHLARGYYHLQRRDMLEAERSFALVGELNEGRDPELLGNLATYEMGMGRLNRMEALREVVRAIDPVHAHGLAVIWHELYLGRYQSVVDIFDRYGADAGPEIVRVNFWALLLLGREADAVALVQQRAPQLAEEFAMFRQEPHLARMSRAGLRTWAARHFGDGGHNRVAHIAILAGIEHQPLLAIELLRLAHERPAGGYGIRMFWHPALAEARKLPEFAALVTDLGFVRAWRKSGEWSDFCRPVTSREITCT